jgi:hypothetical protein
MMTGKIGPNYDQTKDTIPSKNLTIIQPTETFKKIESALLRLLKTHKTYQLDVRANIKRKDPQVCLRVIYLLQHIALAAKKFSFRSSKINSSKILQENYLELRTKIFIV